MLDIPDQSPVFDHELSLSEKEEEEKRGARIVNTIVMPQRTQPVAEDSFSGGESALVSAASLGNVIAVPSGGLQLEVKTVPEEPEMPLVKSAAEVKAMEPYDPILDLRDYKFSFCRPFGKSWQ